MTRYYIILLLLSCCIVQAQYSDCGLDNQSTSLAKLIVENVGQKRVTLTCNKLLAIAAQKKAEALAKSNKISHIINHVTPNEFLESYGIELPAHYQIFGNQTEAIQGGIETSKKAFDYFMSSRSHKEHILGENIFFQQQDQIGVGYFQDKNTSHEVFWVVYITKIADASDREEKPKMNQKFVFTIEKNKKRKRFRRKNSSRKFVKD